MPHHAGGHQLELLDGSLRHFNLPIKDRPSCYGAAADDITP
jgi:hypothetical protein